MSVDVDASGLRQRGSQPNPTLAPQPARRQAPPGGEQRPDGIGILTESPGKVSVDGKPTNPHDWGGDGICT